MTAVCETLGVARSNMAERAKQIPSKARGRPPLADRGLFEEIKAIIADMPTCGYRRVHAILLTNGGRAWPNAKRVCRVMKLHGLLLQCHTGAIDARRHDGRVAVEVSNLRWCSVRIPVKSAADSETKPATYSDRTGYRHYRSDPAICRDCPLLAACTSNAAATRTVTRHVWADATRARLTSWGKATVERSFADAKQLHDHRYGPDQGPEPKARRAATTHTSRRNPLDSANPKTKTRRKYRRACQQSEPAAEAAGHTPILDHAWACGFCRLSQSAQADTAATSAPRTTWVRIAFMFAAN